MLDVLKISVDRGVWCSFYKVAEGASFIPSPDTVKRDMMTITADDANVEILGRLKREVFL